MYIVPKGLEHKPFAQEEVQLLLIEPRGVLNTGESRSERTAELGQWILHFLKAAGFRSVQWMSKRWGRAN